ncbi:MAG: response regulator [Sporomusaceae bacterium]|nr:response regulator [Sporomusaceae bacterium]
MSLSQATILIVDDQPGIRRLLLEVLSENGYAVETAANGYEGLQKAREVNPELLLMDMKMPGLDGIETLRELRRIGLDSKVIMMTAYGELDMINEAKELGALAYITKPFDILSLCQLVEQNVKDSSLLRLRSG